MSNLSASETEAALRWRYTANRYMRELTDAEQRLQGVYDLVLSLVGETIEERPDTTAVVAP